MGNIILFIVYISLSMTGLLLIKIGGAGASLGASDGILAMRLPLLFLGGVCSYAVSFLLYVILLQRFELSKIVPVSMSSVYVLTILASLVILRETVSVQHWIGIALILAGLLLVTCPPLLSVRQ